MVATEGEIHLLESQPDLPHISTSTRLHFAILSQLISELQGKHTAISTHDSSLPNSPQTRNERNAHIYRTSQLSMLAEALDVLNARLVRAITPADIHEQDAVELLTLETALSILYSLDHPVLSQFGDGLARTLGSADVGALRAAGWEAGIWTLWLGAMLIWNHSLQASVSDVKSSTGEGIGNVAGLRRWLARLMGATAYGDPLSETRAAVHSLAVARDADLAETVADLVSLVEDAAAKLPGSGWASAAWSEEVLRWAAVVVRMEGVAVQPGAWLGEGMMMMKKKKKKKDMERGKRRGRKHAEEDEHVDGHDANQQMGRILMFLGQET